MLSLKNQFQKKKERKLNSIWTVDLNKTFRKKTQNIFETFKYEDFLNGTQKIPLTKKLIS